jgi:hypothetical protein
LRSFLTAGLIVVAAALNETDPGGVSHADVVQPEVGEANRVADRESRLRRLVTGRFERPARSWSITREDRMAFTYRLEQPDGTPADPPTFRTSVSVWRAGDTIPLGRDRTLRIVAVRSSADPEADPVLVVEPI